MTMMTSQEEKYKEVDRFLAKDRKKNFKLLGDKSKDTGLCCDGILQAATSTNTN